MDTTSGPKQSLPRTTQTAHEGTRVSASLQTVSSLAHADWAHLPRGTAHPAGLWFLNKSVMIGTEHVPQVTPALCPTRRDAVPNPYANWPSISRGVSYDLSRSKRRRCHGTTPSGRPLNGASNSALINSEKHRPPSSQAPA